MGLVLHKSSLGQGLGNKGTVCPSGWVALRGWGGGVLPPLVCQRATLPPMCGHRPCPLAEARAS